MAGYGILSGRAAAFFVSPEIFSVPSGGSRYPGRCEGGLRFFFREGRLCLTVFRRGFPPDGDGFVERGTRAHPDSPEAQKRVSVRPRDGGADRDGSGKFFQNFPEAGETFRRNETARDADNGRPPASGAGLPKRQNLFGQDGGALFFIFLVPGILLCASLYEERQVAVPASLRSSRTEGV